MKTSLKYTKWIVRYAYPFFLLCTLLQIQAQNTPYQFFEQLAFEKARQAIDNAPPTLELIYLDNLNDCAELLLNEDSDHFELLEEAFEARLKQLDEFPSSTLRQFIASEIRLQWAFTSLKYKHNWQAFWLIRRAKKSIETNLTLYPDHALSLRTSGVLNIVLDLMPEKNQWILRLLGMEGDFSLGHQQLQKAQNIQDTFWNTEAKIMEQLVDTYLLELETDVTPLGEDPIYQYIAGLLYNKHHQSKKAIKAFQQLPEHISVQPYLLAESYFNSGDYSTAITHYSAFLANETSENYQKDGYLKLGLAHWFKSGKKADSQIYFDKAIEIVNVSTEIDRNAVNLLNQLDNIPREVFMLRFALDGGNYEQAKELIHSIDSLELNTNQQFEFLYRKARYFQLTNQLDKAERLYMEVINQRSKFEETYFVPNSYLQLGKIKMANHQDSEARKYFEEVLKSESHSYKQSLDIKAKIALKALDRSND